MLWYSIKGVKKFKTRSFEFNNALNCPPWSWGSLYLTHMTHSLLYHFCRRFFVSQTLVWFLFVCCKLHLLILLSFFSISIDYSVVILPENSKCNKITMFFLVQNKAFIIWVFFFSWLIDRSLTTGNIINQKWLPIGSWSWIPPSSGRWVLYWNQSTRYQGSRFGHLKAFSFQ